MTQTSSNGLATAGKYYAQYGLRARDLKGEGRKVIGYLSAFCPIEILTAAGVVPIRLKGNVSEAITKADAHMETIVCPFIRNVFDSALKGKYDYLDGMVLPHLCDSTDRTSDIWNYNLRLPYFHFLNMPHVTDEPSVEFTKEILRMFIASLEKFTGDKITDADIAAAIKAHNENRTAVRDLYSVRKHNPPLISGVEMTKVLVAAMSLPVDESTALIKSVTQEVRDRNPSSEGKQPRIMIISDQIDDVAIPGIIEEAGAILAMDDISVGAKMYWPDVDVSPDPIRAIAERYLRKLKLPTLVDSGMTYQQGLETRFGHIKQFISDFKIDGAILVVYRYCDPYGFEVPTIKSYIESTGVPVLYLEDEYSVSTLPRMKTRIEAFLEMIEQ
jgi:benzoyl-CoA reductase subunit C